MTMYNTTEALSFSWTGRQAQNKGQTDNLHDKTGSEQVNDIYQL